MVESFVIAEWFTISEWASAYLDLERSPTLVLLVGFNILHMGKLF